MKNKFSFEPYPYKVYDNYKLYIKETYVGLWKVNIEGEGLWDGISAWSTSVTADYKQTHDTY